MTITPFGAAGEVTGSNWLVDSETTKILVDCGAFQGSHEAAELNRAPFKYDPTSIDAVVLTHAHLDHCGRLPHLTSLGFRGPIYCTPATRDITEIALRDAATIASHDEIHGLGYTIDDVEQCLKQFRAIDYSEQTTIAPGIGLELNDAGHILGAASARLTVDGKRIVFSGDIGNPGSAIVRDPQHFDGADVVVMEATYGDREHHDEADPLAHFIQLVEQAVARGGVVLIPAFSIERTQEILYAFFESQKDAKLNRIPVFLDSPMAIRATDVFRRYPKYYDQEAIAIVNAGRDFFRFPMLKTTLTAETSKAIAHVPAPKIIIAGSGMLTGGRMLYHLIDYLGDPSTTLIFTGYQANGTLGRRILNGDKEVHVKREVVPVRAQIESLDSLSAHADRSALLQWLQAIPGVKQVIIGHADDDARISFSKLVHDQTGLTPAQPKFGEAVEVESPR